MFKICVDPTKLSFDYVPPRLPCREKHLQELANLFRHTVHSRITQNVFLHGYVGTGKTVTARRFCIDFKNMCLSHNIPVEYVHINCRQRMNEVSVMTALLRYFQPDFPDRGFSVQDMLGVLEKILNWKKMHLLLVLDEVDVLLRKKADLIYNITRINEDALRDGRVSLILISQINVFQLLDPSSMSTFKRSNIIRFERYAAEELYQILTARAEESLAPGTYSDEVIRFIAEVASKTGDARHAIELLENAVILAEGRNANEITIEDARAARAREVGLDVELLENLDRHKKLVLLAISQTTKTRSEVSSGEIERTYASLCELYGERKRGHTQFWKYLKELADMGLITARSTHTQGTTTLISLSDVSAKELEEIIEKML